MKAAAKPVKKGKKLGAIKPLQRNLTLKMPLKANFPVG
jgi:hypothetical protein